MLSENFVQYFPIKITTCITLHGDQKGLHGHSHIALIPDKSNTS